MKKVLALLILTISLVCCSSASDKNSSENKSSSKDENSSKGKASSSNNDLATYTWEQHGVSFTAPDNLKEVKNNSTRFYAENDEFGVDVEVVNYEGASEDDMAAYVISLGKEYGLQNALDAEVGELNQNGFVGLYLEGTVANGVGILCVLLLLDPETDLALGVKIAYKPGLEELGAYVVNSFTKN